MEMVRRHCAIEAGFFCAFSPSQEIRRRKLLMGDVISEARHLSLANWWSPALATSDVRSLAER
jgi:hypothetical protein